jgi:probable HAF family extracellular repeat protein
MLGIAINANGDVAGMVGQHAALYRNGTVTDLGVLPGADPLTDTTQATAVNTSGQVVGFGSTPSATRIGFLYDGAMTAIGALPGTHPAAYVSEANGINDAGQVAGTAWNGTYPTHAFVYDHGVWTDLGAGSGNAINNNGMVTGGLANGDAFIYSGGNISDIGALVPSTGTGAAGAAGTAINSVGRVVGYSSEWNGISTTFRYFFFNGVMNDLKTLVSPSDPLKSQVTFDGVVGINDSRLIAVRGLGAGGVEHRYLLQAPWIDIAPGPLSFPSQHSGTTSSPKTVTVTNAGPASVAIGTISIIGGFSQTNNCGTGLAPGGQCEVTVAFSPIFPGTQTGGLSIVSDGVPVVVLISGSAPFDVSISVRAPTVVTGNPVMLTWELLRYLSAMSRGMYS